MERPARAHTPHPTRSHRSNVRHRRHRLHRTRQPADLRQPAAAAAPRSGLDGNRHGRRPGLPHGEGPGAGARGVPHPRHALAHRQHRPRARALHHEGRRRARRRGPAVLRERAVRHHPRAQRQPHEHPRAVGRPVQHRPAPRQLDERHRDAAQRARHRAAGPDHRARPRPRPGVPGRRAGARAGRGLVRRHRADRRLRAARLPRPLRHPPADPRQARHRGRQGRVDRGIRVARARERRLRDRARRRTRRGDLHHPRRRDDREAVREESAARALLVRVRLPRSPRLGHERHLGVRGTPADGQPARRPRSRPT